MSQLLGILCSSLGSGTLRRCLNWIALGRTLFLSGICLSEVSAVKWQSQIHTGHPETSDRVLWIRAIKPPTKPNSKTPYSNLSVFLFFLISAWLLRINIDLQLMLKIQPRQFTGRLWATEVHVQLHVGSIGFPNTTCPENNQNLWSQVARNVSCPPGGAEPRGLVTQFRVFSR